MLQALYTWVSFRVKLYVIGEACTEDCKLVVTCKMQNRNATDKLNLQCSKLALFADTIAEICGRITMLVYYMLI